MFISPGFHMVKHRQKTFSEIGQCIFYMQRNLTKIMPDQKAVCFQFPKLLRKGTFGNFADLPAKLPEAPDIAFSNIP